jgi:hypothetical protein
MTAVAAEHIAPFRFHDLRHTHVAWLIAGGAPLPHIQARLGHESITTTIDSLASDSGPYVRPAPACVWLGSWGLTRSPSRPLSVIELADQLSTT